MEIGIGIAIGVVLAVAGFLLGRSGAHAAGVGEGRAEAERRLAAAGSSRQQLGRDAFVAKAWEWKQESGGIITQQLRRMGSSLDWTRERFTMDPQLSSVVEKAFIDLYAEGLIYRGNRLVIAEVRQSIGAKRARQLRLCQPFGILDFTPR